MHNQLYAKRRELKTAIKLAKRQDKFSPILTKYKMELIAIESELSEIKEVRDGFDH